MYKFLVRGSGLRELRHAKDPDLATDAYFWLFGKDFLLGTEISGKGLEII